MTCWYPRCLHPAHREGVCLRHYCAWLEVMYGAGAAAIERSLAKSARRKARARRRAA